MRVFLFSPAWTVGLNVGAWLLIHFAVSYLCYRMPQSWFRLIQFPLFGFEVTTRFYEKRLKIKKWKGLLPDGSSWFKKGFRKRHLASTTTPYLETFILESRRAELTHWLCLLPAAVLFPLWNDGQSDVIMILYALMANLPCILVQRYNRMRLERILWQTRNV